MTKTELKGVIRALLAAAGGFIVARGWIDQETMVALVGAGATVLTAIWSVKAKRVS